MNGQHQTYYVIPINGKSPFTVEALDTAQAYGVASHNSGIPMDELEVYSEPPSDWWDDENEFQGA